MHSTVIRKRPDEFHQLALAPFTTWGCVCITQDVPRAAAWGIGVPK